MSEKTTREARRVIAEQAEMATDLTRSQKLVLRTLLFKFFNVKDFRCFPFDRSIMSCTMLSEKTVRRARQALIENRWIECHRRPTDKRRRNYRFPRLVVRISEMQHSLGNSKTNTPQYRSKCPKKPDRMTGSPIFYKTTPNNQGEVIPIGRQPLIVDSPECLEMNEFLKNNGIQTLGTIYSPTRYCGQEVYWLKYEKPSKGWNF